MCISKNSKVKNVVVIKRFIYCLFSFSWHSWCSIVCGIRTVRVWFVLLNVLPTTDLCVSFLHVKLFAIYIQFNFMEETQMKSIYRRAVISNLLGSTPEILSSSFLLISSSLYTSFLSQNNHVWDGRCSPLAVLLSSYNTNKQLSKQTQRCTLY